MKILFSILLVLSLTACFGTEQVARENIVINQSEFRQSIYKVTDPNSSFIKTLYDNAELNSYIVFNEADERFLNSPNRNVLLNSLESRINNQMQSICAPSKAIKKAGPDFSSRDNIRPDYNNPAANNPVGLGLAYAFAPDQIRYRYICQ